MGWRVPVRCAMRQITPMSSLIGPVVSARLTPGKNAPHETPLLVPSSSLELLRGPILAQLLALVQGAAHPRCPAAAHELGGETRGLLAGLHAPR